jgi:small GTP-binding protein
MREVDVRAWEAEDAKQRSPAKPLNIPNPIFHLIFEATTMKQYRKKIMLLGDPAVGKTSLIRRFVSGRFDDKYIATIGTKVSRKNVIISTGDEEDPVDISFMIWDVLGQHEYERLMRTSFEGAEGALMVTDITRKETLDNISDFWIPKLFEPAGEVPVVLLANKIDLEKREFSETSLLEEANKHGALCAMTSALTGDNVETAFRCLAKIILESPEKRRRFTRAPILEIQNLADVLDVIMTDFIDNYGDHQIGMGMLRKQCNNAGVDIKDPQPGPITALIDSLYKIEESMVSPEAARMHKTKRLSSLRKVTGSDE